MDRGVGWGALDKWPLEATGKACPTRSWNSAQTREGAHGNTENQLCVEGVRMLVGLASVVSLWTDQGLGGAGGRGRLPTPTPSPSTQGRWGPESPPPAHLGCRGKAGPLLGSPSPGGKFLPSQSCEEGLEKSMGFFF